MHAFRNPWLRALLAASLVAPGSARAQDIAWNVNGTVDGSYFGQSVGGGGDVDMDGTPDCIVGAPQANPYFPGAGYARVFSGRTGAVLRSWNGDSIGDQFGRAVCMAGDMNQDGRADLVVGAPRDDNTGIDSGHVRVFSGADGAPLHDLDGAGAGDLFGSAVSPAGDVDGDGRADFMVGAPQTFVGPGYVRIHSGRNGAVLRAWVGDALDDRFGGALALAGDVDADGLPDWIIGAVGHDGVGPNSGLARVYSGASATILHAFQGATAGDELGNAVAGAGDLDNDGHAELIVAAWHDDAGLVGLPGRVSVFAGIDGSVLYRYTGITSDDLLGKSVAAAGDVDGDGFADFMYAGRHDLNEHHPGDVYVRSGRDGALLFFLLGDRIEDDFGIGLAPAGDVDGDGLADFLVAGTEAYHFYPREGYARIYRGCPGRVVTYSGSCPGSTGYFPHLWVRDCPVAGGTITFEITDAVGLDQAFVGVGRARGGVSAVLGCAPLVTDELVPQIHIHLSPAGTGARSWTIPASLPSMSRLDVQAFILDRGVAGGVSSTNAIELTLP